MHISAADGTYPLAEAKQKIIPKLKGHFKIMVKIIHTVPDLDTIAVR